MLGLICFSNEDKDINVCLLRKTEKLGEESLAYMKCTQFVDDFLNGVFNHTILKNEPLALVAEDEYDSLQKHLHLLNLEYPKESFEQDFDDFLFGDELRITFYQYKHKICQIIKQQHPHYFERVIDNIREKVPNSFVLDVKTATEMKKMDALVAVLMVAYQNGEWQLDDQRLNVNPIEDLTENIIYECLNDFKKHQKPEGFVVGLYELNFQIEDTLLPVNYFVFNVEQNPEDMIAHMDIFLKNM